MKVVHFPISTKNSYQKCLFESLEVNGVEILTEKRFWGLKNLITFKNTFDLFHLHWTPIRFLPKVRLLLTLFILKLRRIPIVWTIHNLHPHESQGGAELVFLRIVAHLVDLLAVFCPEVLTLVSDEYKVSTSRICVIGMGVYTEPIRSDVRASYRDELGINKGEFVFLYFGMIRRYKGVESLIQSYKQLDTNATLVIAGELNDNDYKNELIEIIGDSTNVRLIDRYIEDLDSLFKIASVVVLPFKNVLNSSSILVAMANEKMVVAPRLGCIPHFVPEDTNILYDPDMEDGLTVALNQAYNSPYEEYGRSNKEYSYRELRWDKVAKNLIDQYERLVTR